MVYNGEQIGICKFEYRVVYYHKKIHTQGYAKTKINTALKKEISISRGNDIIFARMLFKHKLLFARKHPMGVQMLIFIPQACVKMAREPM